MMRHTLLLLLALVVLPAATADAAVTTRKAIWGPVEIDSQSQFPVYRELGAGIYQTTLDWSEVASLKPLDARDVDDPSYAWPDEIDTAIAEARKVGIAVALTVTGTPEWANSDKPATTGPTRPSDFAIFVAAAAKRYPSVHLWSIWEGTYRGGGRKYAQMLDATYVRLKAASKRNVVIGGNSRNANVARWISQLRLTNGRAPRMDLYGHDISGSTPPTRASLRSLERRIAQLGNGLALYLSPVKLDLTPAKQAAWISAALRVTKADPAVETLGYRGLVDDPQVPSTYKGLLDADGTRRAAFTAFKNG